MEVPPLRPIPGIQLEDQPEEALLPMVLWGEARGEIPLGKLAILWVIKNRAQKYGTTMKHEILKPEQFSSFNHDDPNRRKLMTAPNMDPYGWRVCEAIGDIFPFTEDPTSGALNYYAPTLAHPNWGRGNPGWIEKAMIGNHVFGIAG